MAISEIQRYRQMQHVPDKAGNIEKYDKLKEVWRRDERLGTSEEAEKRFNELINKINNIRIDPEFKDNPGEIELLKAAKQKAEELLTISLLPKVKLYIIARNASEKLKRESGDYETKEYQRKYIDADKNRKLAHNALISDLHSAIRYIRLRFAEMDEDDIYEWEAEEEKAGRKPVHAKRIKMDGNLLIRDDLDVNDREIVEDWAEQINNTSELFKKRYSI